MASPRNASTSGTYEEVEAAAAWVSITLSGNTWVADPPSSGIRHAITAVVPLLLRDSRMANARRRLGNLRSLIPSHLAWPVGQPSRCGSPVPACHTEKVNAGGRVGQSKQFGHMNRVTWSVDQQKASEHIDPAAIAMQRRVRRRCD